VGPHFYGTARLHFRAGDLVRVEVTASTTAGLLLPPMMTPDDTEALRSPLQNWIVWDEYDTASKCRSDTTLRHHRVV
jgi:hypothetical protein